MAQVVGPNGEVLIEPELRERLGVQPGSVAVQRVVNNHLEIEFVAPPPNSANRSEAIAMGPDTERSAPDSASRARSEPAPESEPLAQVHNRSLFGALAPYAARVATGGEDWHAIKEKAWEDAIAEEWEKWTGKPKPE